MMLSVRQFSTRWAGWLEPFVIERETTSNWQNNSVRVEENELEELEEEEEEDINVSTFTSDSPIQPVQTQAVASVPSVPTKRTSAVQEGYLSVKIKRKQSRALKLTLCSN